MEHTNLCQTLALFFTGTFKPIKFYFFKIYWPSKEMGKKASNISVIIQGLIDNEKKLHHSNPLNPKRTGGRDKSITQNATGMRLHDFFLSLITQLLRPNSARPRVRSRSHTPSKNICQAQNCSKTWFYVQIQCKLWFCNKFT